MAVKPATPLLPLDGAKSSGAGAPPRKPSPAPAWRWTWTRLVRYVSLYYLVNVIGLAITVDGFRRLGAAGNVDMGARARATGVIAAGSMLRAAAAAVATTLWRDRFGFPTVDVPMIEFTLVTIAMVVYVVNTIDLC
ncbi:hypothetical protein ACP70R_003017 [Stipagrostis hirtigluma subsp. patula]